MDSQETELIKIATLQGRYGLESRQAVYDRINGLDIKPVARGKISPQQLELLDTNSLISKSDRSPHFPTFYISASLTPNTNNFISKSDSEALRRNRRIFPQEP